MMNISGISGVSMQTGQTGITQEIDAVSKSLKNQIETAQNELQQLSSNDEMSMEEKMEKRKELQRQINDLNYQLKQRQMEQRRASREQESRDSVMEEEGIRADQQASNEQASDERASDEQTAVLSDKSVYAIISADASMSHAEVEGRVIAKMEGKASVLESEMKLDTARGQSVERKEKELTDMQQRANAVSASRMKKLGEANQVMKKAAKERQKTDGAVLVTSETKASGEKRSNTVAGKAARSAKQVFGSASFDIRM